MTYRFNDYKPLAFDLKSSYPFTRNHQILKKLGGGYQTPTISKHSHCQIILGVIWQNQCRNWCTKKNTFNYLVSSTYSISFKSLHIKAYIYILICFLSRYIISAFYVNVMQTRSIKTTTLLWCNDVTKKISKSFHDMCRPHPKFYSFQYFITMSTCTSNKRFHYIKSLEFLFVMNQYTHN